MKRCKILGIIPARGSSKGIPRKNIVLLNGKPLIFYTINEALKSKYLEEIYVSSEDKEIIRVSKKYGAKIIQRPSYLARDNTTTIAVVEHALRSIKTEADIIVLLQPTAPLRKAEHIDGAIELLWKKWDNADAVVSLCKLEEPHPYKLKIVRNGYVVSFIKNEDGLKPRQFLPIVYRLNGALYIVKTHIFKKYKTLLPPRTLPYYMNEEESINIDTEKDLILSEYYLKKCVE